MRELNIEFQEQYKRLDKLCKEIYNSGEGVSAYIQDMERTPYDKRRTVHDWDAVYKQLKHYRWMRNQLAHEIDIDTYFCERADIVQIKQFYESILKGIDPLAVAYKARTKTAPDRSSTVAHTDLPTPIYRAEKEPRKSLWRRIASKIKSWFS